MFVSKSMTRKVITIDQEADLAEAERAKENARRSGNLRDLAMAYEVWLLALRDSGRKHRITEALAELRSFFNDVHFREVIEAEMHRLEPKQRRWIEKVLESVGLGPGRDST